MRFNISKPYHPFACMHFYKIVAGDKIDIYITKSIQARPTLSHKLGFYVLICKILSEYEKGQRTTHGIFHSGRGDGCSSGNFEYIYFGNQNQVL